MSVRKFAFLVAGALGLGLLAYADPPGRSGDLPPGLAKQGKIPPGHAKKIWGKGEYLPPEYHDAYFRDWSSYDLRPAPDGNRWVLVEEEVYLVDVASGVIADVIVDLLID